ncbi:ABC transporter permease subunit [Nocardioides sp. AN3]
MSAIRQLPLNGSAPLLATRRLGSAALRRGAVLAPVAALCLVFFVWPLLTVLLRSLDPAGQAHLSDLHLSLAHYREALTDATLRRIIGHTFVIAAWATALTGVLAFPVAYLISRLSRRAGMILLSLVMLQFWVSILVRLFAYTQILGRDGLINRLASTWGHGPYALLFNTPATIIGMIVYLLPYMVLILHAGMSGVDHSLLTAARTLGASPRQAFLRVYLPMVRSSIVTGLLLIFVLSLGFFLTPAVLGGPRDTTVAIYIQQQIDLYQWGTASAIGILLLVVTLIGYVAAVRLGGLAAAAPTGGASSKGTVTAEPLRFSTMSVALWVSAVLVLAALLLPLLVVVAVSFTDTSRLVWPPQGFTVHWYADVLQNPLWTDSIRKSAVVASGVAVASTSAGLVLARTMAALRSATGRTLLLSAVYAPLVVPLILLAIGVYDVQARLGLLGSTVGLVLAHTVIALPFAFAILNNALANIDSSLEPAAWTLGASRQRAFRRAVLPNIVPSVVAALLVSFITSWDEPVIALFQTGLDKTLPVTIFTMLKSGVTPALAAVATMMLVLVVLLMVVSALIGSRRAHRQAAGVHDEG